MLGEFDALRDSGRFRTLLLLTDGHLDQNRLHDVLFSIRQRTQSKIGSSHVDLYSAYGGDKLLSADADWDWATHMGYQNIARYIKAVLQPGRALREKFDGLRSTRSLIGGRGG